MVFEVLLNAVSRAKSSSIDPKSNRLRSVNDDRRLDHQINYMALYLHSNAPLVPVFHQRLRNLFTASHDMSSSAQDVRTKFVVGRANSGKTTLLRKIYNATGKPKIFDGKGNQVDPTFHPTLLASPTDRSQADQCGCRETLRRLWLLRH
ncbi:hypothetical protein M405DRAFT_803356 [Rhizopogon salebrosus TDB-379]|nr:hypothetical protein M405DRAFT_803356 [Rhizopogon salebrosus TDB-379]